MRVMSPPERPGKSNRADVHGGPASAAHELLPSSEECRVENMWYGDTQQQGCNIGTSSAEVQGLTPESSIAGREERSRWPHNSPKAAADQRLALTLERSARDNATFVIVETGDNPDSTLQRTPSAGSR